MATQFVFIVKISAMENMFIFYTMYFLSARKSLLIEILTSDNNVYSGCLWIIRKFFRKRCFSVSEVVNMV